MQAQKCQLPSPRSPPRTRQRSPASRGDTGPSFLPRARARAVDPVEAELDALHRAVGRWKLGAGGPVAIIGEPRSGRSTMANLVAREIVGDRTSVRVTPPTGGTSSADELNQAVVRAVGGREGQSAEIALRAMPPGAVLVVDDLGRWIERTPGGLGALRLWHQLWRRLGDRHLFVLTATPFAWAYAGQLLGLSESFLDEIRCGALTRFDLEELILLRQRTSDYTLDLVGEQGSRRRARFRWNDAAQLKRLHERSRGNPGDALELWRRSIVGVNERRIEISIGMSPDAGVLDRLPLRWYAALTSIALHRSVTTARMARVMRQTREEAVGQLSDLERASLVYSERNGGWTLDPALQPHILEVLKKRRMLG